MDELSALKDRVCQEVDAMRDDLVSLSKQIYTTPETAFQERKAMAWLGAFLQERGFAFEPGIAGLETAFRAQSRGAGSVRTWPSSRSTTLSPAWAMPAATTRGPVTRSRTCWPW